MVDRVRGCLVGLAVGDAVGTTLEFEAPGSFEPIDDLVGGGPFGLEAGQWTDDTSMALCLAESLLERGGFDAQDQMERYVRWWRSGHLSSTGRCFDIGLTTSSALSAFQRTGNPFSGSTDANQAGNGSLMRIAPIALRYQDDPEQAIWYAGESSRTTHGAPQAIDACRWWVGVLVGALGGATKEALLTPLYAPIKGYWEQHPLHEAVALVASGSYREPETQIAGTGYVVKSLEAALWAFDGATTFRDGCLKAVNLGADADTTGAIYGQLAGAYYGYTAIPQAWRERISMHDMIVQWAEQLAQRS